MLPYTREIPASYAAPVKDLRGESRRTEKWCTRGGGANTRGDGCNRHYRRDPREDLVRELLDSRQPVGAVDREQIPHFTILPVDPRTDAEGLAEERRRPVVAPP